MSKAKNKKNAKVAKSKSNQKEKEKNPGNVYDNLVKNFLGKVFVFIDFLINYANPEFVSEIEVNKIYPAPTHYIGPKGNEQIIDLIFKCPLKRGKKSLLAVIIFEHQNRSLREIPRKLIKYISAIWETEEKDGQPLSVPYFIVLRTGERPLRGKKPQMSDRFPKGRNGKPIGNSIIIEYDVVDLPEWDFDKLVGRPEVRVLLGILKKMIEGDADGTFDSWPDALLPLLEIEDEKTRIEITKDILDFVAKVLRMHNQRLDTETVRKAIKPVFKEKEDYMFKTIFEEKFDEGVAIGEVIGVAKEKVDGKIETIFMFLADRFNGVPKKLEKKIQKITDVEKLKQLVKFSTKCESLKEFEKALD